MRTRIALLVAALAAIALLLLSVPAGAAVPLGGITISNPAPAHEADIQVASTGWQPRTVVSVSLSGTDGVLARATADRQGVAHVRVAIPGDAAPGSQTLSVIGTTVGGFPQQITSGIAIAGAPKPPAPERPWPIVFVLVAIATMLMLVGERSERSQRAVAVGAG